MMPDPFPPPTGAPIALESPKLPPEPRARKNYLLALMSVLALAGIAVGLMVALGQSSGGSLSAEAPAPSPTVALTATTAASTSTSIQTSTSRPTTAPPITSPPTSATRSTGPPATQTLPPITAPYDAERFFKVTVRGEALLCEVSTASVHACDRYVEGATPTLRSPDMHCEDGSGSDYSCTTYDPRRYFAVTFDNTDYICDATSSFGPHGCVRWISGSAPPIAISFADLYCTGSGPGNSCDVYHPDDYFEMDFGGTSALCDQRYGTTRFECQRFDGRIIPTFGLQPFAYCSGTAASPSCSTLWYPSDLDRYDLTAIGGQDYICEPAFGASFGDLDCYRYDGGDPMFAVGGLPDQYCSPSGGGYSCDPSDYPSVWDGLSVVTIEYADYICKSTFQGQECYRWYGGSPASMSMFFPDYYCNTRGCDSSGYP
jgi:hypothetical protein